MNSYTIIYRDYKNVKHSVTISAQDRQAAYDYYYDKKQKEGWELIRIDSN